MIESTYIYDYPLTVSSRSDVLDEVAGRIESGDAGLVVAITNTESLYHARRDRRHGDLIRSSTLSLCDGVGVVIGGWFWGGAIPRFHGPDFMMECIRQGEAKGWKHYFYGGKEGVADAMASKLREQFPGLRVVGTYCPPFRELSTEEEDGIVGAINAAEPDFVWVGLGLVKQERWIARFARRLNATWLVGVGAAFDFHSGAIKRSPIWVQKLGLESVIRLIQQPRIRAPRYWWSIVFLAESVWHGLARRAGLGGR